MILEQLSLTNFRGFEQIDIALEPCVAAYSHSRPGVTGK